MSNDKNLARLKRNHLLLHTLKKANYKGKSEILKKCNDKLSLCNKNSSKIYQEHLININDINITHKQEITRISDNFKGEIEKQRGY